MENADIPHIKPELKSLEPEGKKVSESILIPKIGGNSSGADDKKRIPVPKKSSKKIVKVILALGGIIILILIYLFISFWKIYQSANSLGLEVTNLSIEAKNQNLPGIKSQLTKVDSALNEFKSNLKPISWMKATPYLGSYIGDIEHAVDAGNYLIDATEVVLVAIEPYADILGFAGQDSKQAEDAAKTTQDRLDFLVKSIPDLIPRADEISQKISLAQKELVGIDPEKYPEKVKGKEVRSKLIAGIDAFDEVAYFVINGKPLLEAAPYLLGIESPRTYMVLFQNDKELRPTGGFMTAYSIMKVSKGKFEPVSSNDIYNLDSSYRPSIDAPDAFIKYLKGPYVALHKMRLRDMNWSPDFADSMKVFTDEAESIGIKNIDGVIAVDTQVLVYLLDVLGPIGVSGYGNFSNDIVSECNCPQVIHELESFADIEGPVVWSENEPGKIVYAPPNYDNRKKIIGPLMNSILANAFGQPKEKLPALFEATFKSLREKHVLFYLLDAQKQQAIESFEIGGKITDFEGDYLHINDANLGGRKSNLYVTQEVNQEISVAKDGTVEKNLTITYKNPAPYDGWLNSVLPNYVRVYVPKGSELVSSEGLEEKFDTYEEFGKSVFAGYFQLRPQGVAKITFKYKLPFKVEGAYPFLIQKQPGTGSPLYTITMGKIEEEFFLTTDKQLKLR